MPIAVSKDAVRSYLARRQKFLKGVGKEGTLQAVRNLECVQMDPVRIVERNHHLVLRNRVGDYRPSFLEELLYRDRRFFEYWCNLKSIIPIEDFPYFWYRMQNPSEYPSPFLGHIKERMAELKGEMAQILSEVKNDGPLSSSSLKMKGKISEKLANDVLRLLWDCGELMVHHIEGDERYYDLTERVLPPGTKLEPISQEDYEDFMVRKYLWAYGLADTRDWKFGWVPMKSPKRREIVEEMVQLGELHHVEVEGLKSRYYILEKDLALLEEAEGTLGDDILFIAPLDNLIWNRHLISEVFGFDYSWEMFTVPRKRVFGCYVMPILQGTRFIGRLDPKLDRKNGIMIFNSIWMEGDGSEEIPIESLAEALHRFQVFHGALKIEINRTEPAFLKEKLIGYQKSY